MHDPKPPFVSDPCDVKKSFNHGSIIRIKVDVIVVKGRHGENACNQPACQTFIHASSAGGFFWIW